MRDEITVRRQLRDLFAAMRYRPALFTAIILLSIGAAVLEGLGVSFILPIVEQSSPGGGAGQGGLSRMFARVYDFLGVPMTLETVIAGAAAVITLRYLLTFLSAWLRAELQAQYVRKLQLAAFDSALDARVSYFDKQGSDDILNAIVTQARYAGEVVAQAVMVLNQTFLSLMYVAIALLLAPYLTLLTAVVLSTFLYVLRYALEPGYSVGDRVANANEEVQEAVQAGTQGIRDVKLFGMTQELFQNFRGAVDKYTNSTVHLKRNQAAIDNTYRWVAAVTVFGLIYGSFVYSSLSLGGLGVFLMAMFRLAPRLSTLNNRIYEVEGKLPHLVRTREFIDSLEDQQEPRGASEPTPEVTDQVAFEGVQFAYDEAEDQVLRDVSFTAERGSFVAFVGPSGAGKSTIVSLLCRMYRPEAGRITASGLSIEEFDVGEWRQNVAVVRQNPFIFNQSLRYNVTIGRRDVSEREVRRVCEIAQVTEFLDELPEGMDTVLGDDGVRLSGGQRQRIVIARALLKDADVLVLDEATSDLDMTLEERVHSAIEESTHDQIMIVIAHRLPTVKNADCIFTMKAGRIIEYGTHDTLMTCNGEYAELYATQS